jgi:hypothetical protein
MVNKDMRIEDLLDFLKIKVEEFKRAGRTPLSELIDKKTLRARPSPSPRPSG